MFFKILVSSFSLILITANLGHCVQTKFELAPNLLELTFANGEWEKLNSKHPDSSKIMGSVSWNRSSPTAIEVKLRGQTCLQAKRHCLAIKYQDPKSERPVIADTEGNRLKGKTLDLASLWQDFGYLHSRMGALFMSEMELFYPRETFTQVQVNGKSYGLYLIMEKPDHAIREVKNVSFIARRNTHHKIDIKLKTPSLNDSEIDYQTRINELYHSAKHLKGQELLDYLSEHLDIQQYFNWLTLNSLLKNGDYVDELFFYAETSQPDRYKIMAWDFDDLFKKPHRSIENLFSYRFALKKSILYSMEDTLDRSIAFDPLVYESFKGSLNSLLIERFTTEKVESIIEKLKIEISPYLELSGVLDASRVDEIKRPYTKKEILDLLELRKTQILQRREELLSKSK